MSESSDDSVDSVIAVHDHRRLYPASISSSIPIEQTTQKDFPENKPVSKPSPLHSKVITATPPAIPDTQIKETKTNIQIPEHIILRKEASDRNTNRQIKDELDTVIKELDDSTGDSNTKLKRKRRDRKASKSVSKKEIESVPEEPDLDENKEQTPYLISCETKRKQNKISKIQVSENPQSVTPGNPNELNHGTKLVSGKSTHLNASSKEHDVQESKITEANKEKVDTHEMGNRFSSEKTKLGKEQEGKEKIKESKKKGKGKTSKSLASDRESSIGNRSSIETTDSYSSAATLVATANAAVCRRSPKKSPRVIPRSGVKLRDVISSDDESFVSAGFRTPQATTPLLKRATDPSSPSQRLLEFGKNIEREITEKFTNRSPTDQKKKAIKNRQWSSDNQQTVKVNTDSNAASIPDKLFSSLPKRCSKDGTVETDSDSFAMFENTERLYTSLPKDYYPIDDNLSDDVFMSCIDLAANSPDIPSRSQASRNSVAQQSSPASTKKELLAKQQRSPIPVSKHISPPQNRKKPFGIGSNPSDVSIPLPRIFTNSSNKSSNNPLQTHKKTTEETKAPRTQKLLKTSGIRQDETSSNKSPDISKRIIGDLSKSPGQTTHGQAYNSTSVVESPSAHSPGNPKSLVENLPKSPKTLKRSQKNGSKSPASQHHIYVRGSESPTCQKYSQVDSKSPTIQRNRHDDSSKSPTIQRLPQANSSKSPTAQRRPHIDSSISPTTQRRLQTDALNSPTSSQRQQISKSPKTSKREMPKSSTSPKRPPDESSRSPQIPKRRQVEGSVSPKVPKRHQKDGSLSPGISRRIGNEISYSPLQQRKDHEPALYCTINKPGKETSVTAVAQTTNTVSVSSFPSCARAEEESSQIQDSPKAQKQEKVLIAITNKKEHLRSTYDNVPDSDDSMVYFTSKNDPVFFEDNCVSEEIIATEQTPLHYKAEEPKKLGIEILKTPSKAKIECVFLEREKRILVDDKEEKIPMSNSLSEPNKAQTLKKDTKKAIVTQTFQNSNFGQSHQLNAKIEVPQASTSATTQVACTPIQVTDQIVKQQDVPTEHLTKRQIRRRNKKKSLQMVGKGSLDSGSDAPLSPHAVHSVGKGSLVSSPDAPLTLVPTVILQLSKSDSTKEATRDSTSEMETNDKQHDCNVASFIESKTYSSKSPEPKLSSKACNVLSQDKNDSAIITAGNVTVLYGKSQIKNNSDTCDHVPPPSPLAVDTLKEIAEEDEDTEEVANAFIDEKAREVLVFGDSVLKRLSSLVESQGDNNELDKRFRCGFDEDTEELSDDFGDKKTSCLVVLDELCNMGEKFKQETETIKSTNVTLENDIPQTSEWDIIESSNHKSEMYGCVQKRPGIPCELQLNTKSDTNDVHLDNEIKTTSATEPKRDSQQITEVINSYSDDITPTSHSYPEHFPHPDISTFISNQPEIKLRKPESSSDEDFHSPMRRFSGDAFKIPAIEETFSELMSVKNILQDMEDKTPTSEVLPRFIGPDGMASPPSHLNGSGRRSRMSPAVTERTESELDMSEQLDNISISTDSMYADDEDDGSEIIFDKTYTEDKGGECLVSYTFYNTTHDYDSDEFWAESSAAEENYKVLENSANQASCTFKKARSEMHEIQRHLQDLRRQMEYLQDDVQGTSLTPSLSLYSSEWRPITE